MFDLDQAIAEWRRQMLAAGIKTPVPLEELESHLREDVEKQVREGSIVQQAFEIAVGRIGQPGSLKTEFKKINGPDPAQLRKRAGFAFALILGLYSLMISCLLFKNDLTFNERLSGFASVATMLTSVFILWQILPRLFPVIAHKTVQSAIGLIGGISGAGWFLAFAYLILPHCEFTQGQLLVAVSWAMVPTLVLPATSFLIIDKNESQPLATTGS
jgi:hypothetical protein